MFLASYEQCPIFFHYVIIDCTQKKELSVANCSVLTAHQQKITRGVNANMDQIRVFLNSYYLFNYNLKAVDTIGNYSK